MASLYEVLSSAHDGEAMTALAREFGLTPTQTQAAVTALLPAISAGLKQSTTTLDGLGNLFGMMGHQVDLRSMYDDPKTAFAPKGVAAGNDAVAVLFGSPQVTDGVIDQAQRFSGVGSGILQKMLPVLAGILVSGLMKNATTGASTTPSSPAPSGGSLGDILGQIFRQGMPSSPGASPGPSTPPSAPSSGGGLGDILGQIIRQGMPSPGATAGPGQQVPPPANQPVPAPTDAGGQSAPGGDLLGPILRELEKGIREGSIKPVIIGGGPVQIPIPNGQGGSMPSGSNAPQMPGDIFGKILRDMLGGAMGGPGQIPQGRPSPSPQQAPSPQMKDLSDLSRQLGIMGGAGAAIFGDHFEVGRNVEQSHIDDIQSVFDRFLGSQKR